GAGRAATAGTGSGKRRPVAHPDGCRSAAAGAERTAGKTGVIHFPAAVRVYLCLSPCDMRKSFDGLRALVTQAMQLDAFGGHLFVFSNRRRDRIKILYWG